MEEVLFFQNPASFRRWLEMNHDKQKEQWFGFYKKGTKLPSITWPESVDEALCFGWIDGLRKRIDEKAYKIRFTPRTSKSHWSAVNIDRVKVLIKEGRMQTAGMEAYKRRTVKNSKRAAYEQKTVRLAKEYKELIQKNEKAWNYFQSATPSYRKQCIWWIMSAKREPTRIRRLQQLIDSSFEGRKIPPLRWADKKKA